MNTYLENQIETGNLPGIEGFPGTFTGNHQVTVTGATKTTNSSRLFRPSQSMSNHPTAHGFTSCFGASSGGVPVEIPRYPASCGVAISCCVWLTVATLERSHSSVPLRARL